MNVNELIDTYQKEITDITELKSQKYIDDKCLETAVSWIERFVEDLESLTNIEYNSKVKIPQFVADRISRYKKHDSNVWFCLKDSTAEAASGSELSKWLWEENNADALAKAWVNGYEVEEEPKYYVAFPALKWNEDKAELEPQNMYLLHDVTRDETNFSHTAVRIRNFVPELTEETIKALDERYWPFAVPVEVNHE